MFYGIIGAILNSLGDIAYKKSVLTAEDKISPYGYQFASWGVSLSIISLTYFFCVFFNIIEFNHILNLKNLLIFCLLGPMSVGVSFLFAYAYKNEKVAVLTPYQQAETIFTVILGFLFFSGISFKAFLFVLLAGFILIVGSIDFKNISFNKYAFSVVLGSFIYSIKSNLIAYILISISPLESIFYGNIFAFLAALAMINYKKEFLLTVRQTSKKMVMFMNFESTVRLLVGFVYAYLVSEVGIIQTTLLGLLTIFSNMIFAYFVFKEVPEKKDYFIALLVIICITLGTFAG
ncbi:MAG: hypothetical protein PHN31_01150 [Candidatus Gracilibacteria bacterium]|nr:hypothetical protein [Candidatus Gracilibacteria bacterium]